MSTFRGRRIGQQLDSDRKPFRKVFRAGNEVIILYDIKLTPESMINRHDGIKLPLEWLYYDEYRKAGDSDYPAWMNLYGLPRIHEMGLDGDNPYIIEEYLEGESMRNVMDNVKEEDWWETYIAMSSFTASCTKHYKLFGNDNHFPLITPDSIFFAGIGDADNPGYEGVAMKFFGIDEVLFPEYHDPTLLKYYDGRFCCPWKHAGAKNHATYSLTLSLIDCLKGETPREINAIANYIHSKPFTPHQAVSLYRYLLSPLFQDSFEKVFETEESKRDRLSLLELKRDKINKRDNKDYNLTDICGTTHTNQQPFEDGDPIIFPKSKLPKS